MYEWLLFQVCNHLIYNVPYYTCCKFYDNFDDSRSLCSPNRTFSYSLRTTLERGLCWDWSTRTSPTVRIGVQLDLWGQIHRQALNRGLDGPRSGSWCSGTETIFCRLWKSINCSRALRIIQKSNDKNKFKLALNRYLLYNSFYSFEEYFNK
jgi:hypothetical protein